MEIDNINSEARDHLANERTYLAWLRTSITLFGMSLALIEFKIFFTGIFCFIIGFIILLYSLYRYFQIMNAILNKKFILNKRNIIIINVLIIIFIITGLVFII